MSRARAALFDVLAAPFQRPLNDEQLAKDRRLLDPALGLVLMVAVLLYGVFEGLTMWDDQAFSSVCYSTATSLPGGDEALKVKHLCYSKEVGAGTVDAAWQAYALKTFTCRGEFGGSWWGVAHRQVQQGPAGEPPAPGGGAPPAPGGDASGDGRLLASSGTFVQPQMLPDFCQLVIDQGEDEIAEFVRADMHDNCVGGGCQDHVDTSVTYSTVTSAGGGYSGSERFYKIASAQGAGFTCCGMRYQSTSERLLSFLGALGGFFGLAQGVLMFVPPYTAGTGSKTSPSEPPEANDIKEQA
jgi:hypothetical protein